MAKDQRQVDAITARDVDFAQWFKIGRAHV